MSAPQQVADTLPAVLAGLGGQPAWWPAAQAVIAYGKACRKAGQVYTDRSLTVAEQTGLIRLREVEADVAYQAVLDAVQALAGMAVAERVA